MPTHLPNTTITLSKSENTHLHSVTVFWKIRRQHCDQILPTRAAPCLRCGCRKRIAVWLNVKGRQHTSLLPLWPLRVVAVCRSCSRMVQRSLHLKTHLSIFIFLFIFWWLTLIFYEESRPWCGCNAKVQNSVENISVAWHLRTEIFAILARN